MSQEIEKIQEEIKKLIIWVNDQSDVGMNTTQLAFRQLLFQKPRDIKRLGEYVLSEKLYENTDVNFIKNIDVDKINWNEFIAKLGKKISVDDSELVTGKKNKDLSKKKFFWVEFDGKTPNIEIKLFQPDEPLPSEVFNFILEVDRVQNAIVDLYVEMKEILYKLDTLRGIAEVGGTSTFNALAYSHLRQLKQEIIINKGNELKSQYLKKYGNYVIILVILCYATSLFLLPMNVGEDKITWFMEHSMIDPGYLINALLIIAGTAIGAWLIFAIQKRQVAFEDLREINQHKKSPILRLVVIELISMSFFFMFITGFINFKFGETFDTANLTSSDYKPMAFLIGLFFGLSESTLGTKLTSRVETFVTDL